MSQLSSYPVSAFHFKVAFAASMGMADTAFSEVSGIGSQFDTEDLVEGGENRFVHKLPKAVKHNNLVLKRGIADASSPLVHWCKEVFESGLSSVIVPMNIMVFLLNDQGIPVRAWSFANAYPLSWEIESFQSTKNEVAIEKLELSYQYMSREL
ncbi:phage tail protein [Aliiglaciecola sp. CAU 1673]|uniref:phage tail protein n=1 Tax=Aliiglaciecola sp. CAU 1673 TaxID=3032595 RepID=UPI0023DC2D87|nr:phage tail protein [Aliiglaciecola sp. CAU 1673]MDF2177193.1 phage tail protein [Aliiglaciecola sp. CAU 1673]